MYFLRSRFSQLIEMKKRTSIIQDRTIYEDANIFTNLQAMLMTTRDFENYLSLFELMEEFAAARFAVPRASVPTLVPKFKSVVATTRKPHPPRCLQPPQRALRVDQHLQRGVLIVDDDSNFHENKEDRQDHHSIDGKLNNSSAEEIPKWTIKKKACSSSRPFMRSVSITARTPITANATPHRPDKPVQLSSNV